MTIPKNFPSFESIKNEYPEVYDLIHSENKMQYPDASYVDGVVGFTGKKKDQRVDIMVLFESPKYVDKYLWCWVAFCEEDDPYLDEYYWLDKNEAVEYLSNLLDE